MQWLSAGLIVAVIVLGRPVFSRADEKLEIQIKILYIIAQTVGKICYTIDQEGGVTETGLSLSAVGQLEDGLATVAEYNVKTASKLKSKRYENVLRTQLAEALQHSQDCKQAVFNTLVDRMMPIVAVAVSWQRHTPNNVVNSSEDAAADTVREFYLALSRADGDKASSLVIPEKRSKGPFSANEITGFFSSLTEPLRLLRLAEVAKNEYQVTYTYRAGNHACAGAALVYLTQRGDRPLIQRIKALQGC